MLPRGGDSRTANQENGVRVGFIYKYAHDNISSAPLPGDGFFNFFFCFTSLFLIFYILFSRTVVSYTRVRAIRRPLSPAVRL